MWMGCQHLVNAVQYGEGALVYERHEIVFLKDTGDDAAQVLRDMHPTPWKTFWNRAVCTEKRSAQKKDDYFMECPKHSPIIWTPKHKLAYMKVPKAASTAFEYFFKTHFSDAEVITPEKLPHDVYVFTFVREPFQQKLAGFAEVDLKTFLGKERRLDAKTTFQHVSPNKNSGRDRFAAFLDDIKNRRFDPADKRKPGHAGSQIGGVLCTHYVHYLGHLENLTADWDLIQTEAKLPSAVRTKALPAVHADSSKKHKLYKHDESVPLTKELKHTICELFRSEFACLGYQLPEYCGEYRL